MLNVYIIQDVERMTKGALETNCNHTLHYLQNISPYIIIECNMHYVSFKKNLLNLKHFQITNIDNLI